MRLLLRLALLLGLFAALHQNAVATFGITQGLPSSTLAPRPATLHAANVQLEQYTDLNPVFKQLRPFDMLRQTFIWQATVPDPDRATWAKWDELVTQTFAARYRIWAVLGSAEQAPDSPEAFGTFAGKFAARYGEEIDVYQIWDEPNLQSGWGAPPSAARYAALLQAAYHTIHAADPTATVLAAALAPTTEEGPANISDLLYLQQLYDLGAAPYFDGASGKPYGFYTGPYDRNADPHTLNFSRFVLLRQVMEQNGDGHKLLWGGNFGWNTLDSPWGKTSLEQQISHTQGAYHRAETEWPWAGALALANAQPSAADDPRWGFALLDPAGQPTPLLQALQATPPNLALPPGNALPQRHPAVRSWGAWEASDLGLDIPEDYANARLEVPFNGTDFALRVRRADYRAYLYITIDGHPANLLPQDERGAYLVLTSPSLAAEVSTIPVAAGLDPNTPHLAIITPDRGWDQWAIVGYSVGRTIPNTQLLITLIVLAILAALTAFIPSPPFFSASLLLFWNKLGHLGQLIATGTLTLLLAATTWLTWGSEAVQLTRRWGDTLPLLLTALTAGLFYFSPSLLLTVFLLGVLFILIYLRPQNGLLLIALLIPFYLQPPQLWRQFSSPVELALALTLLAYLARYGRDWLLTLRELGFDKLSLRPLLKNLSAIDLAVGALLVISFLSALAAQYKTYSLREFRLVFLEPILFYALVRYSLAQSAEFHSLEVKRISAVDPLPSPPPKRGRGSDHLPSAIRYLLDAFILGATLMAAIGLYQYLTGTNLITAEGGVARLRSVYGSPNNVALYLDRVIPIALAVVFLGQQRPRRIFYAVCAGVMTLTFILTLSKGGLLLGLPAALAVLLIGGWGKRGAAVVVVGLIAGLIALPFLAQIPRFAELLNFSSGSSFIRTKLWVAAWRMFLDHPWLGVGPDNYLYFYRGFYILPEAWQEPNLSHPHNLALDFLTRLGLPGFLVGLALFGLLIRNLWWAFKQTTSDARALVLGLAAATAAGLAHSFVDHGLFLMDLMMAFVLVLALAQKLTVSSKK